MEEEYKSTQPSFAKGGSFSPFNKGGLREIYIILSN